MSLFLPKRLIIKPQSRNSQKTKEIIERTRQHNPIVSIENLATKEFEYPAGYSPREKFLYMKESAIVSERSESFIRTFDSPGNIIESLTTVLNLTWMCVHQCEYCYLQTNQTPEHYLYTNLNEAEHEIESAPAAHTAILTLWTHLTDYLGKQLLKLPDGFKETSDWLREFFVTARVISDQAAIDRYYSLQKKIVDTLNKVNESFQIDFTTFRRDRPTIKSWYQENLRYPVTLTASEFNDMLAVDHLTGNTAFLMKMVEKYPRVHYNIRTKSAYVDNILRFDGQNRVRLQITLNTKEAIDRFEHGTATLDERIEAARKVQTAKGFILDIVLEPMFTYNGYLDEYKNLIRKVLKELDSERIHGIIFGSLRYNGQLRASATMHYPETSLFAEEQQHVPPQKPDTKFRYRPDIRKELYTLLRDEVRKNRPIPVGLGSETPDLWDALELDKGFELGKRVFEPDIKMPEIKLKETMQTIDKNDNGKKDKSVQSEEAKPEAVKPKKDEQPSVARFFSETAKEDPYIHELAEPFWISIKTQDVSTIEDVLSATDDVVPHDAFVEAVRDLQSMLVARSVKDKKTRELVGISTSDLWSIEKGHSLQTLQTKGPYFRPVKVIGRISKLFPVVPYEVPDSETHGFCSLEITDNTGTPIRTLLIQADKIAADLVKLHADRTRCTFFGAVVSFKPKSGKGEFRFYLHDFVPNASAVDMLEWEPHGEYDGKFRVRIGDKLFGVPEDHPSAILRAHRDPNGIINYIKNEIVAGLGIQALDKAKELERALEFVILQAFSHGRNEILEKLHALIIGPPNVGKAYLTKAALILNTVGQEISSSSGKVTTAGLFGTVKQSGKKNVSEWGILPMNNGGVVCIQEFHDILGRTREEICASFVRMMEEGQIIESTSASTVHPAETAVLLDMNRYSDIHPDREYNSYSDIDIPINMLARFDYILSIPRDDERSRKTMSGMADTLMRGSRDDDWKNRLQYLIAWMKTEFNRVDFPPGVRNHIDKELTRMLDDLSEKKEMEGLVEDMRLRMMRSAFKITKAVATANASSEATIEHADFALRFVQDKIDFLGTINPGDISTNRPSIFDVKKRQDLIAKEYYGKEFRANEVLDFVLAGMDGTIDAKTIRRDLAAVGAKLMKKGLWGYGNPKAKAAPKRPKKLKKRK